MVADKPWCAEAQKPLRADARRNRARVLDAAREVFAAEGHTVPLDEIARRAGVGPGTLYRHFPSKEGLFGAIVADNLDAQTRYARELLVGDDPAHAFETFFCWMAQNSTGNRTFVEALARAGVEFSSTDAARAGAEMFAALGDLLDYAKRAGVVRPDVTAKQAKALMVGVGYAIETLGDGAESSVRLAEITCDGFRVRPPRH